MYDYNEAIKKSTEYFNGDELAANVFISKYALRDTDGNLLESTPEEMHRRLAREFARIELKYANPISEQEIFDSFDHFKFIVPQGSPMSAIGNPYQIQSCSNCFVVDSPQDSYGGILKTDQEQAQLMKRRGGVGFDISHIRPKGVKTKNAARTTDGIGVFMERFSNTTREVAQNGRRGALMITISCHHPEIRTFIKIKKDKKKVTGANISIRLTDEFMNAVQAKGKVNLRWPVESANPSISEDVDATELWNEIIESAWDSAEPGLLYWDTALRYTPSDAYASKGYRSISTNPSLRENTLVLTKNGVYSIKELAESSMPLFVKNYRNEWHPAKAFKSGENKQLVKITFSNNQSVFCTKEHKWPVLNTSGNLINPQTFEVIKKQSIDLRSGDKIYFPDFSEINNIECKYSKEDGFILGWLLGDGWITYHKLHKKNQYGFIFSEEDVKSGIGNTVLSYTNSIAKKKSSLRQDHESKSVTFCTTDENVKNKLESMGANLKCNGIPLSVWTGNKEFISGFIDGIFSSDGYVECANTLSHSRIVLTSKHNKLVEDIQKLLNFYGIKSNIKYSSSMINFNGNGLKEYHRYDLVITGIFAQKFAKKFTLSNTNKNKKLIDILKLDTNQYKNNRNYLNISSIELTDIYEDVYDITVYDDTHTFLMETGLTGNCGEIILSAYDSCRLMCINLYNFVINPFFPNATFDWEKYRKYIKMAQRLMDDMIDIEIEQIDKILEKINSDPETEDTKIYEKSLWNKIREACINGRRTGLGITALGDTLAALGIRYGSQDSIFMVEEFYKALAVNSYISSAEMARDRGAFPIFDKSLEKDHPFIQKLRCESSEFDELYQKYGRRNIANTTTAPTGSVSVLTQTTSGIEPAYLVYYTRRKKINPTDNTSHRVDFVDELGDKWQEFPVFHHHFKTWMDKNNIQVSEDLVKTAKSVSDLEFYEDSPYCKSTSNDVDWLESVKIQAAAQKWICHAISKTCNLPNSATKELVSEVYMEAWKHGCKGFTVYRDGCRSGVLVSNTQNSAIINKTNAPKRPKELDCDIYHTKANGEEFFVLVGKYEGLPYEVFAGKDPEGKVSPQKIGLLKKNRRGHYTLIVKNKECIENVCDLLTDEQAVITRLISLGLRHGASIEFVVDQLEKSPGAMNSYGKALSRVLKKYIPNGQKASGQTCDSCGSSDIIRMEGCLTCKGCGNSKCS